MCCMVTLALGGGSSRYNTLNVRAHLTRLRRRVLDMKKTISGARGESDALRELADVVSASREFRVQEAVQVRAPQV